MHDEQLSLLLLEYLQQSRPHAAKDYASPTEELQSILYSSITADAAAIANHSQALELLRPYQVLRQ